MKDATADTVVANFDWLITPKLGVFGRYSYGRTGINPVDPIRAGGDVTVQSLQLGLGFPDLGKKGALGVISYLIPHSYTGGNNFLLSGGGDGGKQQELEISYSADPSVSVADVDGKRGVLEWDFDLAAGETKAVHLESVISWPEGKVLQ